jgi:UDP-N-acetyl-D-glucosamine dehydrogenase
LVLGLAYKKNVDDTRESPSLTIIDILMKSGANVQYSDPNLPVTPKMRKYNFDLKSVELTKKNINSFDIILLATDHDDFDYDLIEKEARLIVDTRGRFKFNEN